MRKAFASFVIAFAIGFVLPSAAPAQMGMGGGGMMKWKGSGGWGPRGEYSRMYDPGAVETVSGEVTSVELMTPMKGMSQGVHVSLKTGTETVSVHLGPSWYMENQDTKIEKGDKIEVKGSRITHMGAPAIIAAEVKKGGSTLKLRDEATGRPAWAGWRMGR